MKIYMFSKTIMVYTIYISSYIMNISTLNLTEF